MTDHVSPLPYLADLVHLFTEGEQAGGLTIDAVLCRAFADGIADVASIISSLVVLAEANGTIAVVSLPPERRRTPVERRRLAIMAAPLDPDRRILAFPAAVHRTIAVSEGGSAA